MQGAGHSYGALAGTDCDFKCYSNVARSGGFLWRGSEMGTITHGGCLQLAIRGRGALRRVLPSVFASLCGRRDERNLSVVLRLTQVWKVEGLARLVLVLWVGRGVVG